MLMKSRQKMETLLTTQQHYHCIWHGTVVQFRCKKATIM